MNKKIHVMLTLLCMLMLTLTAICLPDVKIAAAAYTQAELPKGTVLIDTALKELPPIQLFYGDVSDEKLHAIHYISNTFIGDSTNYNMACGAFIETTQYKTLLAAINDYRKASGQLPITDYEHYETHNGYGFLSLAHGLSELYIIDLSSYEIFTCDDAPVSDPTLKEYIYHISSTDDGYAILTYAPNTHAVNLYALDDETFSIKAEKHLIPPATFASDKQCALDHMGHVYFTNSHELLMVSTNDTKHLPLSFDPQFVYFEDDHFYALAFSDFFLNYAVFDECLTCLEEGQLNLPNKNVTLISSFLRDHFLYTITQDDGHPNYRNYITIYDLTTKEIVYCLALKTSKNHILLAAHLS